MNLARQDSKLWYISGLLREAAVEPDQRLQAAFSQRVPTRTSFSEIRVFLSLLRSNAIPSRYLLDGSPKLAESLEAFIRNEYKHSDGAIPLADHVVIGEQAGSLAAQIFWRAIRDRKSKSTLSVGDFLRAIGSQGVATGHDFGRRPFFVDALAQFLTGNVKTPIDEIPELRRLLEDMKAGRDQPDDFQYTVTFQEGKFAFRVASIVDDYVQLGKSGLLVPQRALMTQLGNIGLFTKDQVEELEDLMNSPRAGEGEFQKFFERYPHFLRQWDHREVHPHVMLTREKDGPLIPDFILTNREAQSAAILDLKRTLGEGKKKLIRRQDNRVRFADAIQEARAQLRTYGRWFESADNRQMLKSKVGMEIYNPRLMVVIGRSSDFQDEIERATLRADNPDIDVVTYDDIARHARDRMVIVKGG